MSLTPKEVKRLSDLARIDLDEKQQRSYADELSTVVAMLDRLKEVDTTGVPAMTHVLDLENVLREDEVDAQWSQGDALKQAQSTEDGFVCVPLQLK